MEHSRTCCVVPALLLAVVIIIGLSPSIYANAKFIGTNSQAVTSSSGVWQHMKLIGTSVGSKREDCVAVIVDSKNMYQYLLHEGDTIGGTSIKNILQDRIILQTASGDKALGLKRYLALGVDARAESREQSTERIIKHGRHRNYLIEKDRVLTALSNPSKVMDTIMVHQDSLLNQKPGLRVESIEPGSIFKSMGLQSGDLIIGVNDQPVAESKDIESLLQSIHNEGAVELTIRRRLRTYHFDLELH